MFTEQQIRAAVARVSNDLAEIKEDVPLSANLVLRMLLLKLGIKP